MPTKAQPSTLGKLLIRSRFSHKHHYNFDGSILHTTDVPDPTESNLQSITQQNDLEAFLHTASLAGTEFTAERRNLTIIPTNENFNTVNDDAVDYDSLQHFLTIPRRPKWSQSTTKVELNRIEQESFVNWRRNLAQVDEEQGIVMTPYERNLQVWRQLWRVIERSDVIVQIVDARHPLFYRCQDVEAYVQSVSEEQKKEKRNVLLVNKADYLSLEQRKEWAKWFQAHKIRFVWFSAKDSLEEVQEEEENAKESVVGESGVQEKVKEIAREESIVQPVKSDDDESTRIYNSTDLMSFLLLQCPAIVAQEGEEWIPVIGFIGYPNVGKSSTINALFSSKKVSTSATPGKTKHFQTLYLTFEEQKVLLCDCPGLVFPNFASTKAEMVLCGVLPIDQLRDHVPSVSLLCRRIKRSILEKTYGIKIRVKKEEMEKESGQEKSRDEYFPTSGEFLVPYSIARGFKTQGQGNPDEPRSARYVLKDYVNGKLLYAQPPPSYQGKDFNANQRAVHEMKTFIPTTKISLPDVDEDFFQEKTVRAHALGRFASSEFTRQNAKAADPTSKKHFKANRKTGKANRMKNDVDYLY